MIDLIALSIPGFFLLMAIELIAARIIGRRVYRLNDTLDDLGCGIVSQIEGVVSKGVGFALYLLVYGLARDPLGLPGLAAHSWLTWVFALLAVDFAYYWFHRWSHEVNFLWAAHVVHHQSEEYNLAVALRQSAFQGLFSMFVYLPLALLGIPPLVFLLAIQINTVYQFWIHTRLVNRLGPLEWVLNTPSHHRVHHGADPKYLDRNYAGMLIIWDRMFGSFQPEQEEPTYGTTKPLANWNPVWANFDYWAHLAREARSFPRWQDRLRLWFKHPGWRPEQPVPRPPPVRGRARHDADAAPARRIYLFAQFVVLLVATVALLFAGDQLGRGGELAVSAWIVVTTVAIGAGFEQRRWFVPLEVLRLIALIPLALWLVPQNPALAGAIAVGLSAASLLGLGLTAGRFRPDTSTNTEASAAPSPVRAPSQAADPA